MRRVALALAPAALAGCFTPLQPAPTVATAEAVRGGFELSRGGRVETVRGEARVEEGATAATAPDGRAVVRLDGGAWVLLDRATTVEPALSGLALAEGRVWVDASRAEETTVRTDQGEVSAGDATFAVAGDQGVTRVYCASGEVTYRSDGGSGRIQQGMGVALGGGEPDVEDVDLWDDWTGGLADPARLVRARSTPLGVLAGRRLDQWGEARTPLPIRSHRVDVELQRELAVTEVEQAYFNARSDTLEGEWLIRLPDGALVQSFEVDTGSGYVPAVPAATGVEDGYVLPWVDARAQASKLVYDGPGQLRARVYPVAPGATVRLKLRYTTWLEGVGRRRTYVYPMRPAPGEPPLIGELILTADTSRAEATALRAGMGASVEGQRVVLRASDVRPRADFVLDLIQEEAPPAGEVAAYLTTAPDEGELAEGVERYALFEVPSASLVEGDPEAAPLSLVLLVDVSGDTDPEDLAIARALVEAVLRQVTPTDRVALRLADVRARVPEGAPEGLGEATEANQEALLEALAQVHLGGATDLGRSLRDAAELLDGEPRGAVLYLGDGLPTTGDLDATALRRALATLEDPPRFFGLAIGDGANEGLLARLFDGHARAVEDRAAATRIAMELLAEAARPALRGVEVDLGDSVERVYPRSPILVSQGEHLRLVGRLVGELPTRLTVRGHRDGEPFEATLAVRREVVEGGDIRRRWAQQRLRELIDDDAGREAMVDLGVRFGLVSPWTSLIVGAGAGGASPLVRGFDVDPLEVAWGLGGGTTGVAAATLTDDEEGWRRRLRRPAPPMAALPERTWTRRTGAESEAQGDGGLARAAAERALREGERGPRGCYDRRSLVRPDLRGALEVELEVDGQGRARDVRVASSTVDDDDLVQCVLREVGGLSFPATGGDTVAVRHRYAFELPEREFGSRRRCSDASEQALSVRRALWRERLAVNGGVRGALAVWREARAGCEAGSWRARRTLLRMMLRHVGGVRGQVALYQAFVGSEGIADYLRRAILLGVRTPDDVQAVRDGLGLEVSVDWGVFARQWQRDDDPEARLRLVRRWLEVAPEEMDLRLRLLSLLEETGRLAEARRLARELRADPLADARVRTAVGELWLRQPDGEDEARRVFSEIVERAPLDPWARQRLGDVYRAHGWADDAYREYRTLARLRPGDGRVLLLLARAAADAGRTDEALRLEQRLSESTDPGVDEGVAGQARLWTTVRLARLELDADTDAGRREVRRRARIAGVLRDPPAVFAALTWAHPDDRPELRVRLPGADEDDPWTPVDLGGPAYGIRALRLRDPDDGSVALEVRRSDEDELRPLEAELLVIVGLGEADTRIHRVPFTLTRQRRERRFALSPTGELHPG
ncbi:MAG: AgmX/PglI C-terminal domain-containing protein [Sandaracinaceae bacterium]